MQRSNNQYFYGTGQKRPPSARSNAISEIDMNSDTPNSKNAI